MKPGEGESLDVEAVGSGGGTQAGNDGRLHEGSSPAWCRCGVVLPDGRKLDVEQVNSGFRGCSDMECNRGEIGGSVARRCCSTKRSLRVW